MIVAKVNLSEFASGAAHSSLGGQMRNPHDLTRTPAGSSGGTGIAIAAAYAAVGLGTDTGGSIRGPSTANGIVGLKPTHGLISRDGIIPLALSFDTVGPMARSVYDVAAALGVLTGIDPADPATSRSEGRFETDYTRHLKADALKGARLGIARDFLGQDADVDWIVEAALETVRREGATVVDVRFPRRMNVLRDDGAGPNPSRWNLMRREAGSGTVDDYRYRPVRDHALPMVRELVEGILAAERLDAIVYPTAPRRPQRIAAPPEPPGGGPGSPAKKNQ